MNHRLFERGRIDEILKRLTLFLLADRSVFGQCWSQFVESAADGVFFDFECAGEGGNSPVAAVAHVQQRGA